MSEVMWQNGKYVPLNRKNTDNHTVDSHTVDENTLILS